MLLRFLLREQGGTPVGTIETATAARLKELGEHDGPLGKVALALAAALDEGAGMSTAAVANELRATLKELTPDDGGDDFTRLMASLSASVRDTPTP